jgi:hypothetical protein
MPEYAVSNNHLLLSIQAKRYKHCVNVTINLKNNVLCQLNFAVLKRVCLINVTFFVIVGIVDLKKKQ